MFSNTNKIREGDLYEVIEAYGHRFEILYGYYEDFERDRIEPIPIYPLFYEKPLYSSAGFPLATKMQEPCKRYALRDPNIDNDRCADCKYFEREKNNVIGICKCEERKQNLLFDNKEANTK